MTATRIVQNVRNAVGGRANCKDPSSGGPMLVSKFGLSTGWIWLGWVGEPPIQVDEDVDRSPSNVKHLAVNFGTSKISDWSVT